MNRYQESIARMFVALTWLLVAHRAHAAEDSIRAAIIDHQATVPEEEIPYTYYLSLLPAEGDEQHDLERAIKLMIASTSRQQVLEYCVPQRLGAAPVLVINTRHLEWDYDDWRKVVAEYPYSTYKNPQLIRADWLLKTLADGQESDAYRRLLLGGKNLDANRDQILKILGVEQIDKLTWGYIESDSRVAVNKIRLIRSLPIARSSAWGTRDVLQLTSDKDPLENLTGDFAHDGEEWIVPIPKVSLATGQRGHLQAYFLSDGKGNVVDRAPVDLVEDSTTFRGYREIRNPGSCIQCHREGLNKPTQNDVHDYVRRGAVVYSSEQIELTRFYGSDLLDEIEDHNEGYAAMVYEICGLEPTDPIDVACDSFKRAINRFDRPLDILAAAKELDVSPVEWQNTLTTQGVGLSARVVGLSHGRTIPRDSWEEQYLAAEQLAKE